MLRLLPIQTVEELRGTIPHWLPFLPKIAQRTREPISDLIAKVARMQVQPILIWDDQALRAVALLGVSYHLRGDDLIAEWVWMTGTGRKDWESLLPVLEHYLTEHMRCAEIRPICRPGWSRILKAHGYRVTHYMMEKSLKEPPHG